MPKYCPCTMCQAARERREARLRGDHLRFTGLNESFEQVARAAGASAEDIRRAADGIRKSWIGFDPAGGPSWTAMGWFGCDGRYRWQPVQDGRTKAQQDWPDRFMPPYSKAEIQAWSAEEIKAAARAAQEWRDYQKPLDTAPQEAHKDGMMNPNPPTAKRTVSDQVRTLEQRVSELEASLSVHMDRINEQHRTIGLMQAERADLDRALFGEIGSMVQRSQGERLERARMLRSRTPGEAEQYRKVIARRLTGVDDLTWERIAESALYAKEARERDARSADDIRAAIRALSELADL